MQPWPADKIERRQLSEIRENFRNSREHSDEQIEQIVASMREWGWTNPVLVDDLGVLIAGHGRVAAARRLGWTEAPVMVASGWSDDQKRAYAIADNKLALNADWNESMLSAELQQLAESGFDATLTGFSNDDLGQMFSDDADQGTPIVKEVDTSQVFDRFWISIRGPLRDQAAALNRLQDAMRDLGAVTVELGTVEHDW